MGRKLIWLDLETTGLDPAKDSILEVAMAVADFDAPFELKKIYDAPVWLPDLAFLQMVPRTLDMHGRTGLLAKCRQSGMYGWQATEQMLQEKLASVLDGASNYENYPILAGSTVHFDRDFLKVNAPQIERLFHHRHYDVSSIKLFCQTLGMPILPKGEAHRAWDDVLESVTHAQACAVWLQRNYPRTPSQFTVDAQAAEAPLPPGVTHTHTYPAPLTDVPMNRQTADWKPGPV